MQTSHVSRKWTGILFFVFLMQTDCNALNAYLFYEDAQCSGAKSIRGSLVYEYDDSTGMETDGFVIDAYNGPCNYFEGGYHDFLNDSDETDSDMTQGFCITCDGVVGCSASEDSCDEFYTISAADDTDYAEANAQDNSTDVISSAKTFQKRVYSEAKKEMKKIPIVQVIAGATAMVAMLLVLSRSISYVQKLESFGFCDDNLNCLDGLDAVDDGAEKDCDDSDNIEHAPHYEAAKILAPNEDHAPHYEAKVLVPNEIV
jgi:hypothetical protein